MSKITYETDPSLVTLNISIFNDGIHDTVGNVTCETLEPIYDSIVNVAVRVPSSNDDTKYSHDFIRTTVTVRKYLSGNRGNFLISSMVGQLFKYLDFEIKFPMPRVLKN